jgi:hypothetical protein
MVISRHLRGGTRRHQVSTGCGPALSFSWVGDADAPGLLDESAVEDRLDQKGACRLERPSITCNDRRAIGRRLMDAAFHPPRGASLRLLPHRVPRWRR